MARVMLLPPGSANYSVIFVNDEAVGPGSLNKRDDVLLVQFMLGMLAAMNSRFQYGDIDFAPIGFPRDLKMDGICGPHTIASIKSFQRMGSLKKRGTPLAMISDGIVSPVRAGQPWTPHGSNVMTIVRMNHEYYEMMGPGSLTDVGALVTMPKELRYKLWMH
jgi:hypothetical protein